MTSYRAAVIAIFQILFLLMFVTATGTLVTLLQKRWKRSAVWFGAFIVAATVTALVFHSWNRTMLKVDADHRARQAAP
jgi:prepilin signal peptidase PulO-like enzyme (type II secretory pathway)